MAISSAKPLLNDRQFQNWLGRLQQAITFSSGFPEADCTGTPGLNFVPLGALSPLKAGRSLAPPHCVSAAAVARQVLLGFITRRVLLLSLSDYVPGEDYELNFSSSWEPAGLNWDGDQLGRVEAEVALLDDTELESWKLAGLQLWSEKKEGLRKRTGSYYTPPALAVRIVERALGDGDGSGGILDPACGGGVFLLASLDWLKIRHPNLSPAALISKRLYGLDLNPDVVRLARLALLRRAAELNGGAVSSELIYILASQIRPGNALIGSEIWKPEKTGQESDKDQDPKTAFIKWEQEQKRQQEKLEKVLVELPYLNHGSADGRKLAALYPFNWVACWPEIFEGGGFEAVVGNPPYIGFNDYSGVEKAYFSKAFPQIYNLKNDLLYYFIARGLEVLRPGGRLGYVTSRYWKEAAFASSLRRWLVENTTLLEVEDFGNGQLFQEAEIDSLLLFAGKNRPAPGHFLHFSFNGRQNLIEQSCLDPLKKGIPWTILRQEEADVALLHKINTMSCLLGDAAFCRTGVQTGCDQVFLVNKLTSQALESGLARRAIKSGQITPDGAAWNSLFLLYPPVGLEPLLYPRFMEYLEPYRPRLERRQRYDKPFPFYQLQWPRVPEIFSVPRKLVTPYKAPRNTFALDSSGLFFSTDIISVVFNRSSVWLGERLEQFAVNFLNSSLSTYQFRSYSKPVGGGQYDYYANPVKGLAFPRTPFQENPPERERFLLEQLALPGLCQLEIDELVYSLYHLTATEIKLVRNKCFTAATADQV